MKKLRHNSTLIFGVLFFVTLVLSTIIANYKIGNLWTTSIVCLFCIVSFVLTVAMMVVILKEAISEFSYLLAKIISQNKKK